MKKFNILPAVFALVALMPVTLFAQMTESETVDDGQKTVWMQRFNADESCFTDIGFDEFFESDGVGYSALMDYCTGADDQVKKDASQSLIGKVVDYAVGTKSVKDDAIVKRVMITYIDSHDKSPLNPYLVSQFKKFNDEEDIYTLVKYIDNPDLADVAVRTMAELPNFSMYILKRYDVKNGVLLPKGAFAYAIGRQKMTDMEPVIKGWLRGADNMTKLDIYTALYDLGNPESLPLVKSGAKKLYRKKDAALKVGGMKLLAAVEGKNALPYLYKSLKNKNREVRRTALDLMVPYADQQMCALVVKKYAKEDAVADVAKWLGDVKDETHVDYLIGLLSSQDKLTVEEAIRALCKIGNPAGIKALVPMIGGKYQEVIQEAMLASKADITPALAEALRGTDVQKLAVLKLLQKRAYLKLRSQVMNMLDYVNNQDIRDAAFKVLKNISTPGDSEFLKDLLERCDDKYVSDVQDAFIAAMAKAQSSAKDDVVGKMKYTKENVLPRFYKVFASFGTDASVRKLVEYHNQGIEPGQVREALKTVDADRFKDILNEMN